MGFSDEVDIYCVSRLDLSEFRSTGRTLPGGYRLVAEAIDRNAERRGLQLYFRNWQGPFAGRLDGWRPDSGLYLLHETDGLVGGVYLVDTNEFDVPAWGQVHYAWVFPSHRGRGVYSVMFESIIERARRWGLRGVFLNSDRETLPDVYLRWGARPWKTIRKHRASVWRRAVSRAGAAWRAVRRAAGLSRAATEQREGRDLHPEVDRL